MRISTPYILSGVAVVVALGAIGFAAYQYKQTQAVNTQLATLQQDLGGLTSVLANSSTLSTEDKAKLQHLASIGGSLPAAGDALTDVVQKTSPAVVSIVISEDVPQMQVQYINPFGDDPYYRGYNYRVPVFRRSGSKQEQVGAGSGFLIRQDGYIITNRHVVDDDQAQYTVLLSSGQKKTAKVVYRDPSQDIAIIKIDGSGYPTIALGSSSDIKLGQSVLAIGNALGEYNNTVSTGIISGLNRTIEASDMEGGAETLKGVLQTDAAINPGNSGGPLLNMSGKVVGVNVAVAADANGIGFAIPVDAVQSIVSKVLH